MARFDKGTKIGMTTSVPVEIIYAANCVPVDLNNIFITSSTPDRYIQIAEEAGYPSNVCGWIKGIYGVCIDRPDIDVVVSVVRGDCSNATALMETLQHENLTVIPFSYPFDRDRQTLENEIIKFSKYFMISLKKIGQIHTRLNTIRRKLITLDTLTWQEGLVSGKENHTFLVNSSDFNGNPDRFEKDLDLFIEQKQRQNRVTSVSDKTRIGYIGVPPIITDLYDVIEELDCHVVFNEIQRQFSLPSLEKDYLGQYLSFTYPYDIFGRISDIRKAIKQRHIDGIIHYTQSFCFRQIEDIILRKELDVPILTLEGERPARLDARTRIRLETFIEMLRGL